MAEVLGRLAVDVPARVAAVTLPALEVATFLSRGIGRSAVRCHTASLDDGRPRADKLVSIACALDRAELTSQVPFFRSVAIMPPT